MRWRPASSHHEAWNVATPFAAHSKNLLPQVSRCLHPSKVQTNGHHRRKVLSETSKIASHGRASQWEQALWVLARMHTNGLMPDVACYNAAIHACGRSTQWAHAIHVLGVCQKMTVGPDTIGLNSVITACGKGSQWVLALLFLETSVSLAVQVDVISFNATMAACEKSGGWRWALHVFRSMHAFCVERNLVSWNTMITAVSRSARWHLAAELLHELQTQNFLPDRAGMNATLLGCQRASQWQKAIVVLAQASSWAVQADIISYSSALSACADGQQWSQALHLFNRMTSRGIRPDVIAFSAVISACERAALWRHALQYLVRLQHSGHRPNSYSFASALGACEAASKWWIALRLLGGMASRFNTAPNVVCFNAVASSLTTCWFWGRALKLLDHMESCGVIADVASFNIGLRASARSRRWTLSLQLLFEGSVVGAGGYSTAIHACGMVGQWTFVRFLLQHLLGCLIAHCSTERIVVARRRAGYQAAPWTGPVDFLLAASLVLRHGVHAFRHGSAVDFFVRRHVLSLMVTEFKNIAVVAPLQSRSCAPAFGSFSDVFEVQGFARDLSEGMALCTRKAFHD